MQKQRQTPRHFENIEQSNVVKYLKIRYPNALFTSSIAGKTANKYTRIALHHAGYRAGTPDLMIFEPRGRYHSLFIEMKAIRNIYGSRKGVVTSEQLEWQRELSERDFSAHVCYGCDEAMNVIDAYFAIKTPQNAA